MRIVYLPLALAEFPSHRAHSLEHIQMCEAFAAHGLDVTLVYAPRPGQSRADELFASIRHHYGVAGRFHIACRPLHRSIHAQVRRLSRFGIVCLSASIAAYVFRELRGRALTRGDIIYARDPAAALAISQVLRALGQASYIRLVYETHAPEGRWYRLLAPHLTATVAVSQGLSDLLRTYFAVPAARILVERCGVDLCRFEAGASLGVATRRMLGISPTAFVVAYSGRIDPNRGIHTIVSAAERLRHRGWIFLVVGGTEDEVRALCGNSD